MLPEQMVYNANGSIFLGHLLVVMVPIVLLAERNCSIPRCGSALAILSFRASKALCLELHQVFQVDWG